MVKNLAALQETWVRSLGWEDPLEKETACVDHNKLWKFFTRWEYQTTLPASGEICMQVKEQQLELDMEQTGSKLGKGYIKDVYCHPAYFTSGDYIMWNADGMKHKLGSRLQAEIPITSDM